MRNVELFVAALCGRVYRITGRVPTIFYSEDSDSTKFTVRFDDIDEPFGFNLDTDEDLEYATLEMIKGLVCEFTDDVANFLRRNN